MTSIDYASSFMTFAAFQLIFGKLFTFYSIKKVFVASVAIFEVGSLICATAPTSIAFIIGRACAGLGSAGINAGGSAILAMSLFFHPPPKSKQSSFTYREMFNQMDIPGTAVLIPGVICLLLVLQWGGPVYPWRSTPIICLLVGLGVTATTFVTLQMRKKDMSTIPPRIIKQRSVACSTAYVFCAGGALNVFQYFLPIWFQAIQGIKAFDSGTRILPTTLGTVLFSFVAGFGVAKTGYYTPFMIVGAALQLIGASLSTTFHVSSPATQWVIYQLIFGAGAGLGIQQAHTAAQTVLAAADVPTGAVILIFAQIMGGTIWLSVAQNILTSQLLHGLKDSVPSLNSQMILDMGATELRGLVGAQNLDGVLVVYNHGITRVFCCAVALSAAALIAAAGMEWKSIKKTR
ncbi:major facilitator superfamily transporter protein [Rutstroemia sp. NJR-2017a BVV2]|nr:major facilitator superfamily transporter protein [Rutstroemia sp. NJR-2017a BVV2]